MVHSFQVYKKSNGDFSIYLSAKDFKDNIVESDPVDGVLVLEEGSGDGQEVFVQLICSFRYGREEDETMGLNFVKELLLAEERVSSGGKFDNLTKFQDRVVKKYGSRVAFPFTFHFPKYSPASAVLQPKSDSKHPCGIEYYVRTYCKSTTNPSSRSSTPSPSSNPLSFRLRKLIYPPKTQYNDQSNQNPLRSVNKNLLFSRGSLQLEAKLGQTSLLQGQNLSLNLFLNNQSNIPVKEIHISVIQRVKISLLTSAEPLEIPICKSCEKSFLGPSQSTSKSLELAFNNLGGFHAGFAPARDALNWSDDPQLAISTYLAEEDSEDSSFGLIISYFVRIRAVLDSAIESDLMMELPFVLLPKDKEDKGTGGARECFERMQIEEGAKDKNV